MGTGKTEARKYLEEKGFISVRVKDDLIETLKNAFPKSLAFLSDLNQSTVDEILESKPKGVRELMQDAGALYRGIDMHYLVKGYEMRLQELLPEMDIVTDDVRFINEGLTVHDNGGIIIRLNRKGCDGKDEFGNRHITEEQIPDVRLDYTINNNGSIEDLQGALDEILKQCK